MSSFELENILARSATLTPDVDSIYSRYTSKDDKGYLATFLKRKNYSPVKLKYLHESKPVKIDHNKLRTITTMSFQYSNLKKSSSSSSSS
jgi:hypothetical protein